jgi:hypothetical protein
MRSQKFSLHGFRYTTSELFTVIAISGKREGEQAKITENMVTFYHPYLQIECDAFFIKLELSKPLDPSRLLSDSVAPAYTAKVRIAKQISHPKELLALRCAIPTIYLHKVRRFLISLTC